MKQSSRIVISMLGALALGSGCIEGQKAEPAGGDLGRVLDGGDGGQGLDSAFAELGWIPDVTPLYDVRPPIDASVECVDNNGCNDAMFYCALAEGCVGRGLCVPRPPVCGTLYGPVCGCDGITYDNDCLAAAAGVNVKVQGDCHGEPSTPCFGPEDCGNVHYCPLDLVCEVTGMPAECEPRPVACDNTTAPVCGCDGQTYLNVCEAHKAGQPVWHHGECTS